MKSDRGKAVKPSGSGLIPNRHFLIAVSVLSLATVGWYGVVKGRNLATTKEAVEWPEGLEVDGDCRAISIPDRVGPYVLAEDGELEKDENRAPKFDGRPDGEVVLPDDVLESLKINTVLDRRRLDERKSNWYFVGIYRDTRQEGPRAPRRYWRVEVFYYTGGLDTVPHVPERCLVAGGATLLGSDGVEFHVPSARPPWDKPLTFQRTRYEVPDRLGLSSYRYAQYYAFSLNGKPEESWKRVRLTLSYPWVRRCYFAKFQFAPLGSITDQAETDRAAEDIVRHFIPVLQDVLPMPDAVEKVAEAGTEPGDDQHLER